MDNLRASGISAAFNQPHTGQIVKRYPGRTEPGRAQSRLD
uniref:Uncharacterized protein n=1 Tax=Arundo donax TaxID=35708 RepID=A0A0A9B280_ARUDO